MTNDATGGAGTARTVTVAERAIAAGQSGELDGNAVLWIIAAAEVWFAAEDEPVDGSLPNSPMSVSREGGSPALAIFTGADLLEPWREHRVSIRIPGFELLRRIPAGTGVVLNPGHAAGLELPAEGVASIVAAIERHGA
ncbi:SseB family protein [Agrococcus baldri]|uniref:SseB protein N-terminal domain-containing protein n=1 Tax=Agrococcus baldri TaxID=153730 RepID=A0AA87RK26_9MICO|nr:SseB family protein [Agrococcus baldri]GEK80693.1 hypothetical protein ABA31_20440 [Agrococcus baldri]